MDTELNNEILDKEWEEFLDYCLSEYEFWENREQYGKMQRQKQSQTMKMSAHAKIEW